MANRKFKTAAFKRRAMRRNQEGASDPRGIAVGEPHRRLPKPTPRKNFPPPTKNDSRDRIERQREHQQEEALKKKKAAFEQFKKQHSSTLPTPTTDSTYERFQAALKRKKILKQNFEKKRDDAIRQKKDIMVGEPRTPRPPVPPRPTPNHPTTPIEKGDMRRPKDYNPNRGPGSDYNGPNQAGYRAKQMADARHKKFESEVFNRRLKQNRSQNGR